MTKDVTTIEERVSQIKLILSEKEYTDANSSIFSLIDEFNILPEKSIDMKSNIAVVTGSGINDQVRKLNSLYLNEDLQEDVLSIQYNISKNIAGATNDDLITLLFGINFAASIEAMMEKYDHLGFDDYSDDQILETSKQNTALQYLSKNNQINHVRDMIKYENLIYNLKINYILSYDVMKALGKEDLALNIVRRFQELSPHNSSLIVLCSSEKDSDNFTELSNIQYL